MPEGEPIEGAEPSGEVLSPAEQLYQSEAASIKYNPMERQRLEGDIDTLRFKKGNEEKSPESIAEELARERAKNGFAMDTVGFLEMTGLYSGEKRSILSEAYEEETRISERLAKDPKINDEGRQLELKAAEESRSKAKILRQNP